MTSRPALAWHVSELAERRPSAAAYYTSEISEGASHTTLTWSDYDANARALAARLVAAGFAPGERVAVLLPDGAGVHTAFSATERAGLIAVGIGPRAGWQEIEHLLKLTGAVGLLSRAEHMGERLDAWIARRGGALPLRHHLVCEGEIAATTPLLCDGAVLEPAAEVAASRQLGPSDLFLLNSTSGTTGMPKCVRHDQARWYAFHEFAEAGGALSSDDVFMSVVPAPFGFGIWTSHVTPTLLGVPTVVMARFDASAALELVERHRVTVMAAVSTQFIMMLNSEDVQHRDLSSLRVLFTGGEAVPYARAAEFEDRTGARVLQFYGSNETGAVSGTTLDDPQEKRLRTAGRPIAAMNVRLFDDDGRDVTEAGEGQPGCKGPTLSAGYWGDDAASAALIRDDGWMLLGDVVRIDAEGYLTVIGRKDDFIIRGGKNISGPGVEEQVARHPAVALAAAVAMPDPVFGERVCVYVELREGAELTLEELVAYLAANDVSKETFPERLEVVDALPRGSGGKVAKQQLRDAIRRKLRG